MTIVDEIYFNLRDRILAGDLQDGEQLRQLEIAEAMRCSQGPVRHALDRLSNEQLVLLLPNRGYFVAHISLDQAKQAYQLRGLLEPFAAKEAVAHMSESDLDAFDEAFARMREANSRADFKASLGADMAFHRLFYELSGYPLLLKFWELIDAHIRKFVTVTTPIYVGELRRLTELHEPTMEQLHRGDGEALALAVAEHVQYVWKLVGAGAPAPAADDQVGRLPQMSLDAELAKAMPAAAGARRSGKTSRK